MSETGQGPQGPRREQGESGEEVWGMRGPHRLIGTPPPAAQRTLLGRHNGDGGKPEDRWLPEKPDDEGKAKVFERIVALCFVLSLLASLAFIASYVVFGVHTLSATRNSNMALGASMGVAFLAMAVGFTLWVRHLMPHVELTEERKPLASTEADREEFEQTFTQGAEASQFTKRPLLRRTLMAATVPLAIAPIVLLRDLGPLPLTSLRHTVWRKGMRMVVYGPNTPLRAADFSNPGQMITVIPEGYQNNQDVLAKATTTIIKFAPGQLVPKRPGQAGTIMNWTVDNIVAYSKICTHVGCPVALYEQTTHHLLCPCHQSTFDATRGAQVIFGPAPRPLPQLPIGVDSQGYLIAMGDFAVPVGPSFWELGASGFSKGNE